MNYMLMWLSESNCSRWLNRLLSEGSPDVQNVSYYQLIMSIVPPRDQTIQICVNISVTYVVNFNFKFYTGVRASLKTLAP